MTYQRHALAGLALALPIALLLGTIVFAIDPLETALKAIFTDDGDQPNVLGRIYMVGGLAALPVALVVSLWPVLAGGIGRARHRLHLANVAVALFVVALMAPTWGALADEAYRCDVLRIPNCD